jgi:hypothetical protein
MSKQTAIKWLFNKMNTEEHTISEWDNIREEALKIEKEQIKDAYTSALPYGLEYSHYDKYANKYYNETYKKEEK